MPSFKCNCFFNKKKEKPSGEILPLPLQAVAMVTTDELRANHRPLLVGEAITKILYAPPPLERNSLSDVPTVTGPSPQTKSFVITYKRLKINGDLNGSRSSVDNSQKYRMRSLSEAAKLDPAMTPHVTPSPAIKEYHFSFNR